MAVQLLEQGDSTLGSNFNYKSSYKQLGEHIDGKQMGTIWSFYLYLVSHINKSSDIGSNLVFKINKSSDVDLNDWEEHLAAKHFSVK